MKQVVAITEEVIVLSDARQGQGSQSMFTTGELQRRR
jgi:hypothetical protein